MVLSITPIDVDAENADDADADDHDHDHAKISATTNCCTTVESNNDIDASTTTCSKNTKVDDDVHGSCRIDKNHIKSSNGVRFDDEVCVHAHNTVLGYHPDTTDGPPVQLGWKYNTRTSTLHNAPSKPIEYISKQKREETLKESGFQQSEMDKAVEEVKQIHSSRIGNASAISLTTTPRSASTSSYRATVVKQGQGTRSRKHRAKTNFSASVKKKKGHTIIVKSKSTDATEGGSSRSISVVSEQKKQQQQKTKKSKKRLFFCWRS